MISVDKIIVVEGKYDKIRLSSFIDAAIIETGGFRIFKDREKRAMLKALAQKKGLVVITDSDSAGFLIRNHLKSFIPAEKITNVFIPQIEGKEKRKAEKSKEGFLGVEGLSEEILLKALKKYGAFETEEKTSGGFLTKTDLFNDGLSGGENSRQRRERLYKRLGLPCYITANTLIDIINMTLTREEYTDIVKELDKSPE